jgi:DNA repair protein RadA/Sms
LKVGEPAADLAAAAALISSFSGRALPRDTVFFGEISLSGDVRPAPQAELRLKEAAKLGFATAIVPSGTKIEAAGIELKPVRDVTEMVSLIGADQAQPRRGTMRS